MTAPTNHDYAIGQSWTYPVPEGFESSRIVVGAIEGEGEQTIICVSVTDVPVPHPDGGIGRTTIAFMPFTSQALDATVIGQDGDLTVPDGFEEAHGEWLEDPEGQRCFDVPFPVILSKLFQQMLDQPQEN